MDKAPQADFERLLCLDLNIGWRKVWYLKRERPTLPKQGQNLIKNPVSIYININMKELSF